MTIEPFEEIRLLDSKLYNYLLELSTKITVIEERLNLLEEQRERL